MKLISKNAYDNEVYELIYQYWICRSYNITRANTILKKLEQEYNLNNKQVEKIFREYFRKGKVL